MSKKLKKNYAAWAIDQKNFPVKGTIEEKIRFLIGYGVLAPSTHNTQPWGFDVDGNRVTVIPNYNRSLSAGDPDSLGLFISLGACVENICQAATYFGFECTTNISDDSIEIFIKPCMPQIKRSKIIENIIQRHSHKFAHSPKAMPPKVVAELEKLGQQEVKVHLITKEDSYRQIVDLHLESARAVASNQDFVFELVNWLRTNRTRATNGMPGFVVGNSQFKSLIGKIILKRKPELLSKIAEKDRELLNSSSAVAIFTVQQKKLDKETMIIVGRTIEKFWLKVTELGLVAHPLFASIQHKAGKEKLMQALKTTRNPVFFMRVGYIKNKQYHTPREEHNI